MAESISYTPEEVSKILKISRFTVYEMIKRGDLPAYHIGRKVRVEAPDLEQYIQKAKTAPPLLSTDSATLPVSTAKNENQFILCGQDLLLDILIRHLEKQLPSCRCLRNYAGSMEGLLALYRGKAHAATCHLWDSDTDTYNLPYVRRLLPGQATQIINLACRTEGFYVAKNNPKQIADWGDLAREDIRFINREPGSGARVLLDEKLRLLKIATESVHGYEQEETSHLAIASAVARGEADIGLGIEKTALQVEKISFIPLHLERYDLVIRKRDIAKSEFQILIAILRSKEFQKELTGMGGYDLTYTGQIMAET
ncbi:MAG: helix-turn-helix transcriptional regulator [Sporomusaceae bacterium]|nr:helix-turn-helix transcriptional regulator [Sporomusaceae bacterium]